MARQLSGMTWSTLKKFPSVIAIFGIMACGGAWSAGYLTRIALKSPEVTWNKRGDQEPWNSYKDKKYIFIDNYDYSKPSPVPDYKDLSK